MPARVVPVTAVLVAHDGRSWLPEVLRALAASTVRPAHVIAVDTGSTDGSADLLRRALGPVVELPRTTSYAAAVAAGLRAVPATGFVWLLHDDSAPDPDALAQLLRAAADSPTAGVLGPRAVAWDDTRVLVEVGLSVDTAGRTAHGVEPGELDQGQYGGVRDVLAVGTAGALVRRETWYAAGGLDPDLPLREDLDLGWRVRAAGGRVVVVPQARVRHARALTTGARPVDSAPGSTARTDRAAALHVLLANAPGWRAALLLPRLLLGSLLTSLVLLLGRRPGEARDELQALLSVLGRPARLRAARRTRSWTVRPGELRPYVVPPGARLRAAAAALRDRTSGTDAVPTVEGGQGEPTAPLLRRVAGHPGARLTAALLLVALLAARDLLGGGVLSGGRLLPAPAGAGDLWSAWAAGQDEPHLAVLAALATALLGSASAAVDLVLLGCVPLAGAVAWAVLGRVARSRLLRVWAAAAWALLPVATGAVAAGRLGAAVVHVVLPALLLAGWRLLAADPRARGWHPAWALGLALTAVAALQPVAWLLLAVLLLGVAAVGGWAAPVARRRLVAAAIAALLPALLLLPWAPGLLADLHGPGRTAPGLADAAGLPAWHLLLLQPGGPGTPALLVAAPLVLAALAGLLPDSRPRLAAAGWGLALVGLIGAVLLSRSTSRGEAVWPGVPLDLAAAGLLLAVVAGADGLRERLARTAFGWRQLTAVLVVLAAAAVPVVSALDWVRRGADGPVQRVDGALLPAYLRAELAADAGARALVLAPRPDGSVGYAVTGPDGPRLDDARDPAPDLAGPVAALLTPTPSTAAEALADRGIRVVALTGGSPAALDAQPGLAREPGERPALWRVLPEGRPAPEPRAADRAAVALQALLLLAAAVLAGPGLRPRRGLLREPRP